MKIAAGIRATLNEGGVVLVDTVRGGTFCANPVGAKIWLLLQEGYSPEQIADRISDDFKVVRETANADVLKFVSSLRKRGLLIDDVIATSGEQP